MKISKSHLESGAFIIFYLFALFLWTLPYHDDKTPYGDWDAISHWEIADYMSQNDRSFLYLPPFLDYSYGDDNTFVPHTLWYHPPFHTDMAIISAFAGDRMVPIYLTNTIFASSILISVFFVIRKLYGFLPAILSSFLLAFSLRDILPYLWGQWPERFGYAFIPLILYCAYMYITTYSRESSKPVYLYLMFAFLGVNLLIHPLTFFHSAVSVIILGPALMIKERKLPLQYKHLLIALLIFIVLIAVFPYQTGNVISTFTENKGEAKKAPLSRLFHWSLNPAEFSGSVPEFYFSFKDMHGLWTIPFLLIGLLVLLIRRESRDILLLAWLLALYLILHRDIIGKATFLHRSLSASAHIFVPITIIGVMSLPSIIKIPGILKNVLRYGSAGLIVILALIYNMPAAHSILDSYGDPQPGMPNPSRPNPEQIEVSEWLRSNTVLSQNISVIGPVGDLMKKVWWMASYSHRTSYFFEGFLTWKIYEEGRNQTVRNHLLNDYIVMDYSDIYPYGDLVKKWQEFEANYLKNHKLVYNKNHIRVYKYEAS